jgi:hypothetical protein
MLGVRDIHQGLDRGGVRGVEHFGRCQLVEGPRRRCVGVERLDIGRIAPVGANEGVFAHRGGVEEFLTAGSPHGSGIRLHDHVLEAEAREDALIGVALVLVGLVEPFVGVVEGVGVFHGELAATQQPGTRPCLVAVLVLDLVDRQRKVLVRGVQVLHEKGEDLFMGRRKQVVGTLAVLQPEDAVAVLRPASGDLIGLAGKQAGEVHLLGTDPLHLFADDRFDAALDPESERKPGENTGALAADVAGAHEQAVARHLGVGGVLAEGSDKELGESSGHVDTLAAAPATKIFEGRPIRMGVHSG